jgi:hypothetical protein
MNMKQTHNPQSDGTTEKMTSPYHHALEQHFELADSRSNKYFQNPRKYQRETNIRDDVHFFTPQQPPATHPPTPNN